MHILTIRMHIMKMVILMKYYLVGIKGTGMSALAVYLKQEGKPTN